MIQNGNYMNILVTGCNKGLGLGFVKHYLNHKGHNIFATQRDVNTPSELTELKKNHPQLSIHSLDIQNRYQHQQLLEELKSQKLDIVIHNIGTFGPRPQSLDTVCQETTLNTIDINAVAPLELTHKLLPLIKKSEQPKIVFISSLMGSIQDNTSGHFYHYRSSKACLNAMVKSLSIDVYSQGISTLILHPGWVKTDMGGPQATLTIDESVSNMIQQINKNFKHLYIDIHGNPIPW